MLARARSAEKTRRSGKRKLLFPGAAQAITNQDNVQPQQVCALDPRPLSS
jgi:hypothetical protein